jgi:hypothetical protein
VVECCLDPLKDRLKSVIAGYPIGIIEDGDATDFRRNIDEMKPKWSGLNKLAKVQRLREVVTRIPIIDTSDTGRVKYLISLASAHPTLKINASMGILADDIKKSNNIDQMIELSEQTLPADHRAFFLRNDFDILIPKSAK